MNQAEISNVLQAQGWIMDRWGNLKAKSCKTRVHFQKNSVRIERLITYKPSAFGHTPPPEWKNMASDYYKNVVLKDGHVSIGGTSLKSQLEPVNG